MITFSKKHTQVCPTNCEIQLDIFPVFAVDDMGSFSISQMKKDYEAMIASAMQKSQLKSPTKSRPTAAEMGAVSSEQVLEAVRQPLGPFNWALFSVR